MSEDRAFGNAFQLLDVPVQGSELRSLLRVYSFDPSTEAVVRLRIYRTIPEQRNPTESTIPDALLAERILRLPATSSKLAPAYAQQPLWLVDGIPDQSRLRIEVAPLTGGPIWAFVSVTDDQTQHVTTIAPQ